MSIAGAFMVPHPPLIIEDIGCGKEKQIENTVAAYKTVASKISALAPETIIIISPHATSYRDYFHVSPGKQAYGDLSAFNAPNINFTVDYDNDFVVELSNLAVNEAFPAGVFGEANKEIDYATIIPLYFISRKYTNFNVVRIGLSGLSFKDHYRLGMFIKETAVKLNRHAVVLASGDLSHRLSSKGPYGFKEEGPIYDSKIMEVMGNGDFFKLFDFDEAFLNNAGECGHRAFLIMAGALNGLEITSEKLSYEDPFGVGYGICSYEIKGESAARDFYLKYTATKAEAISKARENEDEYITLARTALEEFVRNDKAIKASNELPDEMLNSRAGVFVSLHINGKLRGCMGSIKPIQKNLASEIISNALSAGIRDPRFLPVTIHELDDIIYSVDVLSEPEEIKSKNELDIHKYGVIVSKGDKLGLLLPELEDIDSVDTQISIAKQKAGIDVNDNDVILKRFTVKRHSCE